MKKAVLAFLFLCVYGAACQTPGSPYNNSLFKPVTMTASSQTSAPIQLNKSGSSFSTDGSSFASGTVTLTGTALTTVTFGILGSSDNGITYYPINIWPILTPSSPATTATATSSGLYQFSPAGLTHVEFVTSGTFTATSVQLLLSASPNAQVSRTSNGGGGGGAVSSVFGRTGAITAQSGDYTYTQVGADAAGAAAGAAAASVPLVGGSANPMSGALYTPGIGTKIEVDGQPTTCTWGGITYNGKPDCAYGQALYAGLGQVLHFGTGQYCTNTGIVEPAVGAQISLIGEGAGGNADGGGAYAFTSLRPCGTIPKTLLNPRGCTIAHAPILGANVSQPYGLTIQGMLIDPGPNGDCALDITAEKVSHIDHLLVLTGNPLSTLPPFQDADFNVSSASAYGVLSGGGLASIHLLDIGNYPTPGTYALGFSGGCGGTLPTGTFTVATANGPVTTAITTPGSGLLCPIAISFAAATGNTMTGSHYQAHRSNIYIENSLNGSSQASGITMTAVSGQLTFSVGSGGSYAYANPTVSVAAPTFNGLAGSTSTKINACSTMPTLVPTMSGTGPYVLTGVTAFGGSLDCTVPTIYQVTVIDQPAALYGYVDQGNTDSSVADLVINKTGVLAGEYLGSGSNSYTHEHPIGMAVGFIDVLGNDHFNPECDTNTQFCGVLGAAQNNTTVHGGRSVFAVPQLGYTAFYSPTGSVLDIYGYNGTHNSSYTQGFALEGNANGQVPHPNNTAVVCCYTGSVVGAVELDTQQPVNWLAGLDSYGKTAGNGWYINTNGFFNGSGAELTPDATPTSVGSYYVANLNYLTKYVDPATITGAYNTCTWSITPGIVNATTVAISTLNLTQFCSGDALMGPIVMGGQVQGNGFLVGGTTTQITSGGFPSNQLSTITSPGTTITPLSPTLELGGSGAITYMTPPASCPTTGNACTVQIVALAGSTWTISNSGAGSNGFSAALSGSTLAGSMFFETYIPSLGTWYTTLTGTGGGGSGGNVLVLTGADPTGSTDSHAALVAGASSAISSGLSLFVPKGYYANSATIAVTGCMPFIFGAGAGVTQIFNSATGYDTLSIGPGNGSCGVTPSGKLQDISIDGGYYNPVTSTSTVPPSTDYYAAVKLNGILQYETENMQINGAGIGFDKINNDYGSRNVNLRIGFQGDVNYGINERTGTQGGSDNSYRDSWVTGTYCGLNVAGNAGGIHLSGGQWGAGGSTSAVNLNAGAICTGKDIITGTTGEATVDIVGASFENTNYAYVFRNYDQANITCTGCYFNPSYAPKPAAGLYYGSNMKGSAITLIGSSVSGNWSGVVSGSITNALVVEAGVTGGGYNWTEVGTYMGANSPVIGGTATTFKTFAIQSGIEGASIALENGGVDIGGVEIRGGANHTLNCNQYQTGVYPCAAAAATAAGQLAYYTTSGYGYVSPVTIAGLPWMSAGTPTSATAAQVSTLIGAFTGDATKPAGTNATTVVGINGTILSGLTTGPLGNTTSTGVPFVYGLSGTGTTLPTTVSPSFTTPAIGAATGTSLVLSGCLQNGTSANAQFCAGTAGPGVTTSNNANSFSITNSGTSITVPIVKVTSGSTVVDDVDLNGIQSYKIGATVTSATTIAPTGMSFAMSGTATITTITVPPFFTSSLGNCLNILSTGTWGTGSGGNINTTLAATVSGTQYSACWWGTFWTVK